MRNLNEQFDMGLKSELKEINTHVQWLAIVSYVSTGWTLVVPVQFTVIEVLGLSFASHAMRYRAKYALHHRQVLAIIVCLE